MKPRLLLFILITLLLPAICLAAPKKKAATTSADRRINVPGNTSASDGRRVALVIGNGAYRYSDSMPKLANPVNDADDIAAALRGFGFVVIAKKNLSREEMDEAIADFGRRAANSEAALFYFAGHGLQVKGQNYLVPVDAKISTEAQVPHRAVNVNQLLDEMDSGKNRVNIVMLDACRNNPISGKFRSGATRGLAPPASSPKGTVIIYATDPGNVAADGNGRNGLFTAGLLTAFRGNDLTLGGVLYKASKQVQDASDQKQTPYINGPPTVQREFSFAPGQPIASSPQVALAPRPQTPQPRLSSSLDEILASSEATEKARKDKAEQVKADVAKYEKILSSPRGEELKQTAWNALVSRYPEAEKLKAGDIDGLMSIMKIEGYEAEEGQVKGVPARPTLPFTLSENVWQAIENSEAYQKAPKLRALKVVSNAKLHTEYTGSKSRTLDPSPPSVYNTQKEIIPVSGKCYADKTYFTISNQNSTSTNYYCGTYLLNMGSTLPTENITQLKSIDEITGSLFPMRIGAKQSIKYSVAYLKDRKYDWTQSSDCSVISRIDANKLHTKLTGIAWKIQCNFNTLQAGNNTPSTTYDYYLSDLRVFVGMMGVFDNAAGTSVLPVPGNSYRLYEAQGEYGSRGTMVYSLFDWVTGE